MIVRLADKTRDVKSLISYVVGCMFGRYSLDVDGLAYAGGGVNPSQYRRGTSKKLYEGIRKFSVNCKGIGGGIGDSAYDLCSPEIFDAISSGNCSELVLRGWKNADRIDWQIIHCSLTTNHYCPDRDSILPICDDEYFENDIANRFVDFVRVVYGKETLEKNLKFIADVLGGKDAPRQVIRDCFINDFYADYLKVYQKQPIYWLFDSGRKNGFKCLIYIHRYRPDTIARIRTDYVHEQQARYRTAIAGLENQIANAGTGERVKLNMQLKKLQDQADKLHGYEEKIHHLADQFISIDLDNGVKHNYEIFKDVLAKIK